MLQILAATTNKHKIQEFQAMLDATVDAGRVAILSPDTIPGFPELVENGTTFEENAYLKAAAVTKATGEPAIADDSGLEVDALGGEPGVHSARYTGNHEDSDEDRNNLVLKKLGDLPLEKRTARFVSAICCTFPNGDVLRARGTIEGRILFAPRGENGFGYDPLFLPDGYDKTTAELSPEEKNAISHRGNALRIFKEELRNYYAHK